MAPRKTRNQEKLNSNFKSATAGGWEKPKSWGDGTAGQPLGPPTRADLQARGVENLLAADSLPTSRRNLDNPAPLPEESSETRLRKAALKLEQVALMIQQTIIDMQPRSSIRDEEDWEILSDSSRSNTSSVSEIADEDLMDVVAAEYPSRARAARQKSVSRSSTSNNSRASEDDVEEDVLEAEYLQRMVTSRASSVSESSSSHGSSAAEMNEDETVNAVVAAWLPKLRAGRAIVRQEALAVNRELGLDTTTVSMTTAEAALAATNREMGTAVTMEDVEAMSPIDLNDPGPEGLAPGEFEEDELEEMMMGFIRKVKDENEKALAA